MEYSRKDKKDAKILLSTDEINELQQQIDKEIDFAREHKQKLTTNWKENERVEFAIKVKTEQQRANVNLGRGIEFISTLLSKISNSLDFTYNKTKSSQSRRVEQLNALKRKDAIDGDWDFKTMAMDRQMVVYGRTFARYFADSINGEYESHLEPVDVYDVLIDPSTSGIDIESARYIGVSGVKKNREDLLQGIDSGLYIKSSTEALLDNAGDNTVSTQEDRNKDFRSQTSSYIQKELKDDDVFKFYEWFTTFKGERYYVLKSVSSTEIIKICKLVDLFPPTKKYKKGAYPIISYAYLPSLTEFWTSGPMDTVREIFDIQNININSIIDNTEEHNNPQRTVNTSAFEDLTDLTYRRKGIVRVKPSYRPDIDYQALRPPINSVPIDLYNLLENIREKQSGITAASQGLGDTEGRVSIYEGNQVNVEDRFKLLKRSRASASKRLGELHEIGVRSHLIKRTSIEILGPNGIQVFNVNTKDLFKGKDVYTISVSTTGEDGKFDKVEKQQKLTFLAQNKNNPALNPKKVIEMEAKIVGFSDQEIISLLDVENYGSEAVISEAERDIESIVLGSKIKPNTIADTIYKQTFVNYIKDNREMLTDNQINNLITYVDSLEEIVIENTGRKLVQAQISNNLSATQPPPQEGAELAI